MADSDEEYVGDVTEDEDDFPVARNDRTRSGKRKQRGGAEWELSRTWETLVEGADGTISSTVEGLLEAGKRKRLLKDTTPLQRGIIRHVILILDLSQSMSEKDLRPTRYLLTLRYAQEFVREFFEQNPISQLGVLGLRDGLALRVSDMSGNPTEHLTAIQSLKIQDPKGLPSLQNGLEMARGALFHTPSHGTREVLVIFGSLLSSDPGDIHHTINTLIGDKVRVRIVGLAAQVAICRELCTRTNGGDETAYGVALNEQHFRELMMDVTTPPASYSQKQSASSLLMMGFPSRTVEARPSLCACHSKPSRGGYLCSRCGSKVCSLPAECPSCGLTLILSTHLARSYHHLFPLMNWAEVLWRQASRSSACFACGLSFPVVPPEDQWQVTETHAKGMSVSSRYECITCHNHFCIDCDLFAHEVVHNCPGCQSNSVGASHNESDMPDRMDTTV
ncbi:hypothetical protein N7448_000883 [Penicillium atrosanguineum]|uniref:General transcription and DNA repair factor IIH n=1 Tax=Penicillium atrosanguineum TaxID=1132637 RepID=A0A9W9Q3U6_9EURO|nr:uncharacterized protein N7443_004277 [Penicillium atrosanguineum]KAJ5149305.1 hypothetical protein N7448_000883 [Penicillium atrosanguineum]KAJ5304617.1 hypothetical protein N7443_004277 [Penicillium atrosanguineum]KAJ5324085.1 hypothetical protein N7476_002685 [Penicillium atrosanguineum]